MITIFKNGYELLEANYIEVDSALNRIKIGKSKEMCEKIRLLTNTGNEDEASKLKMYLPSVLFHGRFDVQIEKTKGDGTSYMSLREDKSISAHSGFLILDFDKCDVVSKKKQLMGDQYVYACWVSPSGNGVKALIRCEASIERHYGMYTAIMERYPELDSTSRSISRLCFESYDPDLYFNPNASIWDKTITNEIRVENKQRIAARKNNRVISIAVDMVRASYDGEKHDVLIKAATLLGGYIASGRVNEEEAAKILLSEVMLKNPKSVDNAKKAITDGFMYGKAKPLFETKKLEKQQEFVRREDGEFDFIADTEEMDMYESQYLNGTLEMGLSTGYPELDKYWMIKRNTLVWWAGADNVGKSQVAWYEAVLIAMLYDWKILISSAENGDGQVRKKLKEFYLNKPLKSASKEELEDASLFINSHVKIMTSRKLHTWEDFLIKCEIVYDEGFEFDLVIADPFNAFDIPDAMDSHRHNLKATNLIRTFKENYSAIWVIDHIGSQGTRNRDADNNMQVPHKASVDGGQLKANKTDDFIIVHRNTKDNNLDPEWGIPVYKITEIHVDKIKDTETGGSPSPRTNPFRLELNADKCGYRSNGHDAVREYWDRKNQTTLAKSIGSQSAMDDFLSEESFLDSNEQPPF